MSPTEVISNTIFFRAPDGRIVFRPWGPRGPCYVVTDQQRITRARIQLAYYCVVFLVIVISLGGISGTALFVGILPAAVAGNYVLFWLFSRGLGTTEPPKASPEYVQQLRRRNALAFGRPLLWLLLVGSVAFSAIGAVAALIGGPPFESVGAAVFFGACAAVFAWQLRKL
jgi:hypothetical protein